MCCQMFNYYYADAIILYIVLKWQNPWEQQHTASKISASTVTATTKNKANIGQGYLWGQIMYMEFDQFECILVRPDNKMTKMNNLIYYVCVSLMSSEMRHDFANVDARNLCIVYSIFLPFFLCQRLEIRLNLHVTTLNLSRFKTTICLLSGALLWF